MIPIHDDNPRQRMPVVTWLLTAVCIGVFLLQQGYGGSDGFAITRGYALVPARMADPGGDFWIQAVDANGELQRVAAGPSALAQWLPSAVAEWLTLLTCVFLHGSWLHLIANVWVLHVFGDNVEERMGRLRYLWFYLAAGIGASFAHYLSAPDAVVPTVGASGAIAGVMGAYLVLFPTARVLTWIPFLLVVVVPLPAILFLGGWLAMQVFHGMVEANVVDGVAWWAHIGGFGFGMVVTLLLRMLGALRPAVPRIRIEVRRWRS